MSKKYFEAKNTEEANVNEVPEETKEEQKMEVATTMTLGQRVGNMVGKGIDAAGNGISKVIHSKGFKAAAIIGSIIGCTGAALVAGMEIANRNNDNDDYDEDDSDNDIYVDSIDVTDEDDSDDVCDSSDDYATEETEA